MICSAAAAGCRSFSEVRPSIQQSAQNQRDGFVRFLYYPMDTFYKKREKVSGRPYTPGPCSCYNRSRKEARHMMSLLSSHLEDCSTPQYFCFSVRCEVCGEYWYSSSIPFSKAEQAIQHQEKKELYDAIYQREKERAKLAAGQEARERFSQCPVCLLYTSPHCGIHRCFTLPGEAAAVDSNAPSPSGLAGWCRGYSRSTSYLSLIHISKASL